MTVINPKENCKTKQNTLNYVKLKMALKVEKKKEKVPNCNYLKQMTSMILSIPLCLSGLSKGPQRILPAIECSIMHLAKE